MPIPTNARGLQKPYTINMVGDNDAEINLYGEVVDKHPVDWWTGEKIPGNFIALDEFIKDLDELGTKDNITIHINSVGGSLYAGLAIYNRLKSLDANVTTVNDALAASAASIIFMAGNTRKMNAGSNLMIHCAAGFLYGYYQVGDLQDAIKALDAHNKTGIAVYAERTGKDKDEITEMVMAETWMTGQEAVDAGFADEVIGSEEEVTMSVSPDKRFIVSNGVAMSTNGMSIMPAAAAIMTEEQAMAYKPATVASVSPVDAQDNTTEKTEEKQEVKTMAEFKTVEELRAAFPELVSQIEQDAKASATEDGTMAERQRIEGIEAIEAAIGDKAMVKDAKFGANPMTAEQLAFKAMQAQAAIGNTMLTKMEADTEGSGGEDVDPAPAEGEKTEEEKEADAINMVASFRPKANKKED